jgi:hypothetical protein
MMSFLSKSALGGLLGTGMLVLSTATGSAAIACSGSVCWHTQNGTNTPVTLALLFIQMIGAGDGTNATSGMNMRAVDIGAVRVGWNLGDRKRRGHRSRCRSLAPHTL